MVDSKHSPPPPRVADNYKLSANPLTPPLELHMADDDLPLVQRALPLAAAAPAADAAAARRVFADYRDRRAANSVRAHDADLTLFASFLAAVGVTPAGDLATDPASWGGVSWGLVAGLVQWLSGQGYAVGSINRALSTVKAYAKLAAQAGTIAADEYALIKLVAGYRHVEGKRLDAKRTTTRKGEKKATPTRVTMTTAAKLKDQADPRDRLLLCVLLDHGLRVGEAAALTAASFDLDAGALTFYRPKVDKVQTHRLSDDTLAAAKSCALDAAGDAPLFGAERTIRRRVGELGDAAGIANLSPHDLRHAWATFATRAGTPLKALQDAGGWASPAMPLRYAESQAIANDGVKLK